MTEPPIVTAAFLATAVWQSTFALGLGALAYILWRRFPARAHFSLTLALLGSIALPITSMTIRNANFGLLPSPAVLTDESLLLIDDKQVTQMVNAQTSVGDTVIKNVVPWIGALWLGGAALLLLRLLANLGRGISLLANARPLVNERIYASLESAMSLLGVKRIPVTFTTSEVRCPAIWCWAIHPALLLPSAAGSVPPNWDERRRLAVFSHELAHLKRRDHFAAIAAEVVCSLLWWHPLAWWSRNSLNELSDEACDQWVVASGQARDLYAETLLAMVPQRRSLKALSMVSSKHTLTQRVTAILESVPRPAAGRQWLVSSTTIAICLVLLVACMQTEAAPNKSANTGTVLNASMESGKSGPESWTQGANVDGVEYIWDRAFAKSGTSSLCLRKSAQRYFPIAQWTQTITVPAADHPRTFRLSAWVKADHAYKAILDFQYSGKNDDWKHKWAAYIGAQKNGDPPANHDWQLYTGDIEVPAGTTSLIIGLQIYGPGTVWFDDIELSHVDAATASN